MKVSISRSSLLNAGLLLVLLLYLHAEASEPLLMMLQLFASLILLFVYFLIPVFWISNASVITHGIIGSATVASFLSFPIILPIWSWQSTITERRADTIIQQITIYQKQYGHYPESLEQLVPRQLTKVPSTAKGLLQGRPFIYKTYFHQPDSANALAGQNYSLEYYSGAMVTASYDSKSREWHYDD